jgi:hypothetical protein
MLHAYIKYRMITEYNAYGMKLIQTLLFTSEKTVHFTIIKITLSVRQYKLPLAFLKYVPFTHCMQ